jgi:hypothetical protein
MTTNFSYSVGQAPATQTNDNAGVGKVGEIISSNIVAGSAVALVTGVEKTITSVSLTAGHWAVEGMGAFDCTATTSFTGLGAYISGTTNVSPTPPNNTSPFGGGGMNQKRMAAFVPGATTFGFFPTGSVNVKLTATTTIFLIGFANFTVSTCSAYGSLVATRVR